MERRATPEARLERQRSRTRFKDFGRVGARDLAKGTFGEALNGRLWGKPDLPEGQRIAKYLGLNAALVGREGKKTRALMQSTLPLRTEDEQGDLAPVDLSLTASGAGLEPQNPLVPVELPSVAGGRIEVGDKGLGVEVDTQAQAAPTVSDDRAFYGEVDTDTDLIAQPMPQGLELYFQLRSAASPESQALSLDLPEGGSLRLVSQDNTLGGGVPGSVEIRDDDGVIGGLQPPVAVDADGLTVPVKYRVEDRKVIVDVDHQSGDYAYPILVDPYVYHHWNHYPFDPNTSQWFGWRTYSPQPWGWFGYGYNGWTAGWGNGLAIYSWNQNNWYNPNDYAEWYWQAPPRSYIFRTDYYTAHQPAVYPGVWVNSAFISGIWSPAGFDVPQLSWGNAYAGFWGTICPDPNCSWAAGSDQNLFYFGLQMAGGPYPRTTTGIAWLGAAQIYLYDRDEPQMPTMPNGQGTWVDGTYWLRPTVNDDGLGMGRIEVWGGGSVQAKGSPCYSYDANASTDIFAGGGCPKNWSPDITVDTSLYPEGENQITARAFDILGKSNFTGSAKSWPIYVDHSPPDMHSVTGTLVDRQNQLLQSGSTYSVTANATDRLSGMSTYEFKLNGTVLQNTSNPTFTYDPAAYPTGDKTLTVTAIDKVGRRESRSLSFSSDRDAPLIALGGSLGDADGLASTPGMEDLVVNTGDFVRPSATGGVKHVDVWFGTSLVYSADASCNGDSCPPGYPAQTLNYDPEMYGSQTVRVNSTDSAGNVNSQTLDVTVYDGRAYQPTVTSEPAENIDETPFDDTAEPLLPAACSADPDAPTTYCLEGTDPEFAPDLRAAGDEDVGGLLAKNGPGWGVSDQKPWMFGECGPPGRQFCDQGIADKVKMRFDALETPRVRLMVRWDAAWRCAQKTSNNWNSPITYQYPSWSVRAGDPTGVPPTSSPDWSKYTYDGACKAYGAIKTWVKKARAANKQVLISFDIDERFRADLTNDMSDVNPAYAPSVGEYELAVKAFLKKFPVTNGTVGVKDYTPFNEPNHKSKILSNPEQGARVAGRYYRILDELCHVSSDPTKQCRVAAGDFSDNYKDTLLHPSKLVGLSQTQQDALNRDRLKKFGFYLEQYIKTMGAKKGPAYWAFHPYSTAAALAANPSVASAKTSLAQFMTMTGDGRKVWLTEAGSPLRATPGDTYESMRADANDGLAELLRRAVRWSRVDRYYQYPMTGNCGVDANLDASNLSGVAVSKQAHDSGLLEPTPVWISDTENCQTKVNPTDVVAPRAMYLTFASYSQQP